MATRPIPRREELFNRWKTFPLSRREAYQQLKDLEDVLKQGAENQSSRPRDLPDSETAASPPPLKKGYQTGAVIDLRSISKQEEVMFIGDLHASLSNLISILSGSRAVERMGLGELAVVTLGDTSHNQRNLEMDTTISLNQALIDLKLLFPPSFYSLIGNHDYLWKTDPQIKYHPSGEGVPISVLKWRHYLELVARYGSKYADEYEQLYTGRSALMAVGNGFAAMHAGPPAGDGLKEVRGTNAEETLENISRLNVLDERNSPTRQITAGNYDYLGRGSPFFTDESVDGFLDAIGEPKGEVLLGHAHDSFRPAHWQPKNKKLHFLYSGPFAPGGCYALKNGGPFEFKSGRGVR